MPFCFYFREGLGVLGLEIAAFVFGCVIGDYCFYFVTVTYKLIYPKSHFLLMVSLTVFMYLSSVFLALLLCLATQGK